MPAPVTAMSRQRVDFNLLNVFYAVMMERSVTRAAHRLCMTQPAVSNALQRLRLVFQDELFTKVRDGVQPTERALMIWRRLEGAIETIRAVTLPEEFDPDATQMTFNLAVTDTLVQRVVPPLGERFVHEAPHGKIHFHRHSEPGSRQELERGTLDCAIGMFPSPVEGIRYEPLFADEYVCIMRRGHPAANAPVTLDSFMAARHVLVRMTPSWTGIVDAWLAMIDRQRDVVVVVNSATDAITMVLETDLFVALPRLFVEGDPRRDQLFQAPLPFATEKIIYKLAYHERTARDPAAIWMRKLVSDVVLGA